MAKGNKSKPGKSKVLLRLRGRHNGQAYEVLRQRIGHDDQDKLQLSTLPIDAEVDLSDCQNDVGLAAFRAARKVLNLGDQTFTQAFPKAKLTVVGQGDGLIEVDVNFADLTEADLKKFEVLASKPAEKPKEAKPGDKPPAPVKQEDWAVLAYADGQPAQRIVAGKLERQQQPSLPGMLAQSSGVDVYRLGVDYLSQSGTPADGSPPIPPPKSSFGQALLAQLRDLKRRIDAETQAAENQAKAQRGFVQNLVASGVPTPQTPALLRLKTEFEDTYLSLVQSEPAKTNIQSSVSDAALKQWLADEKPVAAGTAPKREAGKVYTLQDDGTVGDTIPVETAKSEAEQGLFEALKAREEKPLRELNDYLVSTGLPLLDPSVAGLDSVFSPAHAGRFGDDPENLRIMSERLRETRQALYREVREKAGNRFVMPQYDGILMGSRRDSLWLSGGDNSGFGGSNVKSLRDSTGQQNPRDMVLDELAFMNMTKRERDYGDGLVQRERVLMGSQSDDEVSWKKESKAALAEDIKTFSGQLRDRVRPFIDAQNPVWFENMASLPQAQARLAIREQYQNWQFKERSLVELHRPGEKQPDPKAVIAEEIQALFKAKGITNITAQAFADYKGEAWARKKMGLTPEKALPILSKAYLGWLRVHVVPALKTPLEVPAALQALYVLHLKDQCDSLGESSGSQELLQRLKAAKEGNFTVDERASLFQQWQDSKGAFDQWQSKNAKLKAELASARRALADFHQANVNGAGPESLVERQSKTQELNGKIDQAEQNLKDHLKQRWADYDQVAKIAGDKTCREFLALEQARAHIAQSAGSDTYASKLVELSQKDYVTDADLVAAQLSSQPDSDKPGSSYHTLCDSCIKLDAKLDALKAADESIHSREQAIFKDEDTTRKVLGEAKERRLKKHREDTDKNAIVDRWGEAGPMGRVVKSATETNRGQGHFRAAAKGVWRGLGRHTGGDANANVFHAIFALLLLLLFGGFLGIAKTAGVSRYDKDREAIEDVVNQSLLDNADNKEFDVDLNSFDESVRKAKLGVDSPFGQVRSDTLQPVSQAYINEAKYYAAVYALGKGVKKDRIKGIEKLPEFYQKRLDDIVHRGPDEALNTASARRHSLTNWLSCTDALMSAISSSPGDKSAQEQRKSQRAGVVHSGARGPAADAGPSGDQQSSSPAFRA